MAMKKSGFTLIEIVATIGLLAVLVLGTLGYQFHASKSMQMAQAKVSATRLGLLVLENWKIEGGSEHYDPTTLNLGATEVAGSDLYLYVADEIPFYLDLSSSDIQANEETGVTLRELAVKVQWRLDYQQSIPERDDPSSTFQTHVRLDQSGG